jgi:hypothetical protein
VRCLSRALTCARARRGTRIGGLLPCRAGPLPRGGADALRRRVGVANRRCLPAAPAPSSTDRRRQTWTFRASRRLLPSRSAGLAGGELGADGRAQRSLSVAGKAEVSALQVKAEPLLHRVLAAAQSYPIRGTHARTRDRCRAAASRDRGCGQWWHQSASCACFWQATTSVSVTPPSALSLSRARSPVTTTRWRQRAAAQHCPSSFPRFARTAS